MIPLRQEPHDVVHTPPPFPPTLSRQQSYSSLRTAHTGPAQTRSGPTTFVLTTSDGRAYLVRWAPPIDTASAYEYHETSRLASASAASLWTPRASTDSRRFDQDTASSNWSWTGTCFHPPCEREDGTIDVQAQEAVLDRGKGASTADVNTAMDLVAIGCEEWVLSRTFTSG